MPAGMSRSPDLTMSVPVAALSRAFADLNFEHGSAVGVWDRLMELLHHVSTCDLPPHHKEELVRVAIQCTERAVNDTFFKRIWYDLLFEASPNVHALGVIHGYRVLSNAFGLGMPAWAEPDRYSATVLAALLSSIEDRETINPEKLSSLLEEFSETTMTRFIGELVVHATAERMCIRLGALLDPMLLLQIVKWMLTLSGYKLDAVAERLVGLLLTAAIAKKLPAAEVVDTLILRDRTKIIPSAWIRARSASIATVVVISLPAEAMAEVLVTVSNVWGDRSFVARADPWKQALLTHTLLVALARSDRSCLYRPAAGGVTLDLLLSVGISHYFEVDNISVRKHGMRVAQAYAQLIGETLHFPELDTVAAAEQQALADAEKRGASGKSHGASCKGTRGSVGDASRDPPGRAHSSPRRPTATSAGDDSDHEGYSSDSSAELPAYAMSDESGGGRVFNYKDRLLRTNYLRDCLQMLRCPDSKPEARQQQEAALARIPVILASHPPDLSDLCVPLAKELLTASNTFNVEGFEEKRAAAMGALVQALPHVAVPFLTSSLLTSDVPLGLKLMVLEWLMTAAKALANIPASSEGLPSGDPADSDTDRKGKTVIKRPGKLAQLSSRTRYFRNSFGPLSALFFYPIMQLLGKIWRGTLHEVALPSAADKFNVISDLFERDGGTQKDKRTSVDVTLPHLEGTDALLPSQGLVALGVFVHCTVNTTDQRQHALEVITVASAFRQASAVALRRAALYALRLAMEAFVASSSGPARAARVSAQAGPLEVLRSLSYEGAMIGEENGEEVAADAVVRSIMAQPALVEVVDWAANTWKEDADEVGRALKREIVEMAVSGVATVSS